MEAEKYFSFMNNIQLVLFDDEVSNNRGGNNGLLGDSQKTIQ